MLVLAAARACVRRRGGASCEEGEVVAFLRGEHGRPPARQPHRGEGPLPCLQHQRRARRRDLPGLGEGGRLRAPAAGRRAADDVPPRRHGRLLRRVSSLRGVRARERRLASLCRRTQRVAGRTTTADDQGARSPDLHVRGRSGNHARNRRRGGGAGDECPSARHKEPERALPNPDEWLNQHGLTRRALLRRGGQLAAATAAFSGGGAAWRRRRRARCQTAGPRQPAQPEAAGRDGQRSAPVRPHRGRDDGEPLLRQPARRAADLGPAGEPTG